MTSTPIEIRELTIDSFRGVRNTMTLALPGRLTLLLAPNGTGKTTVCNALEWLLTGQVKGLEERDLKCLTSADSAQPRVGAEIRMGEIKQWVERTCGQWRKGDSSSSLRNTAPGALLEFLAPETAMAETGKVATGIRQSWLRGTRLLAGHDLALLLDDEKDSIESRRRVFADLFGVEHVQASLRQIKRYTNELGPELRVVEKEVSRLEDEQIPSAFDHAPPAADFSLSQAAEILKFDLENPEPHHALDSLHAEMARRNSMMEQRAAALGRVKGTFPRMTALEEEKTEMQLQIASASAKTKWLKGLLRRVENIRTRTLNDAMRYSEVSRNLERLLNRLEEVWRDSEMTPFLAKKVTIKDLKDEIETQAHLFSEKRLVDLDGLIASASDFSKAKIRISELEAVEDFSLDEPSKEEMDRNIALLMELRQQQLENSSRLDSLAGPLGELRVAGQAALQLLESNTSNCPLCGHDWTTAQALRTAVDRTLAGATPIVQAVEKQLSRIGEQVRYQEELLARMNRRASVHNEWQATVGTIKQYRSRADQLGLSDSPEQWEREALHARTLRHLNQQLDALLAVLQEISFEAELKMPVAKVLDVVHERITNELQDISTHKTRAERTVERSERLQASLQQRLTQYDASGMDRALAIVDKTLSDLARDWRSLSDRALSETAIDEIEVGLFGERNQLAEVKSRLDAAHASLRYAEEARHAREVKDRLREKHQRAVQLREKLELAGSLSVRLAQHRDGFIREQLTALMPTVRSLFSRVHANHVFDTILHGDESDPLKWFAEIDGNRLPTDHFSQGQRQDLALAIFLARACSLGGTFFLDEPLVHLDDLNRVAVLDILRAIALSQPHVHLVLTTASRPLARHLKEKFGRLDHGLLHVLELQGDPRSGRISIEPMR